MAAGEALMARQPGLCPCCGRGILPGRSPIARLPISLIPRELGWDHEARRWFWFGPDQHWNGRTRIWAHAACAQREWKHFNNDPEVYVDCENERREQYAAGRR